MAIPHLPNLGDGVNREQLFNAASNPCPPGDVVQICARMCCLFADPVPSSARDLVLQPAIWINDPYAVQELGNGFDRCARICCDCVSHGETPDCEIPTEVASAMELVAHRLCTTWKHRSAQSAGAGRNVFLAGTPTGCTFECTNGD